MKTFTRDEMIKELRDMAAQFLTPGNGKELFEQIASELEASERRVAALRSQLDDIGGLKSAGMEKRGMVATSELKATIELLGNLYASDDLVTLSQIHTEITRLKAIVKKAEVTA